MKNTTKHKETKRKIIQIAVQGVALIALCDDGTVWTGLIEVGRESEWSQVDTSWVEITARY